MNTFEFILVITFSLIAIKNLIEWIFYGIFSSYFRAKEKYNKNKIKNNKGE